MIVTAVFLLIALAAVAIAAVVRSPGGDQ